MRFSLGFRIYSIVGLSFCGLIGLAAMQAGNLDSSLKQQRKDELAHLAQLALGIAREEYDAAQRDHSPDELARKAAAARIGKLRYGNGDYFWINDLGPRMVMDPVTPELNGQDLSDTKDPNGKRLFVEFADTVRRQGSGIVEYQWPKPGKDTAQPKLSYVTGFEPWGWVIGTGVYIDDLQARLWDSIKTVVITALILIGLLGTVTLIIVRRMSAAMVQMTSSLAKLGDGNFEIELPGLDRADELGDMARSIEQFKIKADEKARAEALLEEGRRLDSEQAKARALKKMAETVEGEAQTAVGEVASGTSRMAASAALMSESALTLEANSSSVAAAAEQALANAQSVAKASAQLASAIADISSQVNSSRAMTLEAVTAATQAQTIIGRLSEAASKVDIVTNLISEIASQTNLLALNATIEAARAGAAGRGFAVVASEVKSLAEQTAKATSEITQQISEIQQSTQASVASINIIGDAIRNVESITSVVATAIDEQSSVTAEISRTVEETALAAREVATQIVSVSNEAAQTGRRASEIRDGSEEIARKVGSLRATLVRVIRTSTADVDRRGARRLSLGRPGTIKWQGKSVRVTVRDLSSGGAMIEESIAELPVDAPVTLVIEGIAAELAGTVARKNATTTLLLFNLSEQAERVVADLIPGRLAA